METHSSILALKKKKKKIPWTEERVGLQSDAKEQRGAET